MLIVQILGADMHISHDEQVGKYLKEVHGWSPRKINCQFNFNLGNIYVGGILTL